MIIRSFWGWVVCTGFGEGSVHVGCREGSVSVGGKSFVKSSIYSYWTWLKRLRNWCIPSMVGIKKLQNNFLFCVKFWRKSEKNCDHESAQTKKCKMAAMTSSISNFQNQRKLDLANVAQIICRKFHQNRPIRLSRRASTHTHTHTHIHTYIHTPSVPSQHIQSNWLNLKTISMQSDLQISTNGKWFIPRTI